MDLPKPRHLKHFNKLGLFIDSQFYNIKDYVVNTIDAIR